MLRLTSKRCLWCIRRLSVKAEEKPKPKKFDEYHRATTMQEIFDRESPLLVLSQGKVERPPFVRSLFVKYIDDRFLTYPEVLEPAQVTSLTELYTQIKSYVDSLKPDALEGHIPKDVVDTLKSFRVYGTIVPEEFGGLGMTITQHARIIEAFATQPSLAASIIAHSSAGVWPLLSHGTPEQKALYLPKLASGQWIGALAMHELQAGTDAAEVRTTLKLSIDETHYVLNGTKSYVTNGQDAQLFTVICSLDARNESVPLESPISAVLVERNSSGVTVEKAPRMLGLNGAGISTVTFTNVKVPFEAMLKKPGQGFRILLDLQNMSRCMMSAAAIGTARESFNLTIRHAIKTHRYKRPLHEFQMVRAKVCSAASDIYAMESAAYMTAAIVDVVKNPDFVLEAATTRLFCMEAVQRVMNSCMAIHGVNGVIDDHDVCRWSKDMQTFQTFDTTSNMCRLLISMSGVKHAGEAMQEIIEILRDPLLHPLRFVKHSLDRWRGKKNTPRLQHTIEQFIHPSLKQQCDILERCIKSLGYAAENALEQLGAEVVEHQVLLNHLTEIVLDVYILACVISRASRSYCIGLQNSDDEVRLCQVFAIDVQNRVAFRVKEIEYGLYGGNLDGTVRVAESIFKGKKYFAEHPLTRNWS